MRAGVRRAIPCRLRAEDGAASENEAAGFAAAITHGSQLTKEISVLPGWASPYLCAEYGVDGQRGHSTVVAARRQLWPTRLGACVG